MEQKTVPQPYLDFVLEQRLAALGTCHDNIPHVSTVYYSTDDAITYQIASRPQSVKVKNILANPVAALTITLENNPITVQFTGKCRIIEDVETKVAVMEKIVEIANRNTLTFNMPPLTKLEGDSIAVIEFVVTSYQFSNFVEDKAVILEGTL